MGWSLTLYRVAEDAKFRVKPLDDRWQLDLSRDSFVGMEFSTLREVRRYLMEDCGARAMSALASDNTDWLHWPGDKEWGFDIALREDPVMAIGLVDVVCRCKDFIHFFHLINLRWPKIIIFDHETNAFHDEDLLQQFWTDFA